jgi:site-specific DNA-methyltransferase (adenine-specific)
VAKTFYLSPLHTGEERIHTTQKPIQLYKWILQRYAKAGDKILDTHVGSASSLIACHRLGFNYVGFELDTEYYNRAKERLDSEIQAKTIKDFIRLRVMQKGADI